MANRVSAETIVWRSVCLYFSRPVTFYTLDRLSADVTGHPTGLASQRDWAESCVVSVKTL